MQQKIIILQQGDKSLANCKHNEHAVIESFFLEESEEEEETNQCALHQWENHPPQRRKSFHFKGHSRAKDFPSTRGEWGKTDGVGEKTFSFLCEISLWR